MKRLYVAGIAAACLTLAGCHREPDVLRVGYSASLAQAAALIGVGSGRFTEVEGVPVRVSSYSGGPSTVEAMLAGDLDVAYVDPVPALSAYARSNGNLVIVAGAATGGVALIASHDGGALKPSDLASARVAVPEPGSTQDVAARTYFGSIGFSSYEHGGNFHIISAPASDLKSMFESDQVDAAWTVEPWATELVDESRGRLLLDEASLWTVKGATVSYPAAVVVARRDLVRHNSPALREFLKLHSEITAELNQNSDATRELAGAQLAKLTHHALSPAVLKEAWTHLQFSTDVSLDGLQRDAADATRVGYLTPEPIDFSHLTDFHLLKNETGSPRRS